VSARANIAPKWSGVVTAEGVLKLDARGLFFAHLKRLANQPIELVVRKLARPKSTSQLGYLFGIVYPVIGETYCDTDYDADALHDALMRKLRGLKPEPNPLQMRETLRDKDHEYVSDYISDLRMWALDQGIVTPDATKVEPRNVRVSKAA
jgi:hypothetical protein